MPSVDDPRRTHDRDSLEFGRVLAFTDGVFAIAITLLVLSLTIPADIAIDDVAAALWDLRWQVFSFFLSFTVIGAYWLMHHRLVERLARMDRVFVRWNLVQLAFVVLLPFPTSLVGAHSGAPVSVATYAVNVALVSALDTWLLVVAVRRRLFEHVWPREAVRFAVIARGAPVVVFLLSVPLAWVSTSLATWSWILLWPAETIIARFRPADMDTYA